jgi:hypothetical protein
MSVSIREIEEFLSHFVGEPVMAPGMDAPLETDFPEYKLKAPSEIHAKFLEIQRQGEEIVQRLAEAKEIPQQRTKLADYTSGMNSAEKVVAVARFDHRKAILKLIRNEYDAYRTDMVAHIHAFRGEIRRIFTAALEKVVSIDRAEFSKITYRKGHKWVPPQVALFLAAGILRMGRWLPEIGVNALPLAYLEPFVEYDAQSKETPAVIEERLALD